MFKSICVHIYLNLFKKLPTKVEKIAMYYEFIAYLEVKYMTQDEKRINEVIRNLY